MKQSQIFWGVLFVSLGIMILLFQIFDFSLPFSNIIGYFWPLAIILIGAGFLIKSNFVKLLFSGFAGLGIGIVLFGIFSGIMNFDFRFLKFKNTKSSSGTLNSSFHSSPVDSTVKSVKLHFSGGAGSYRVYGITDNLYLLKSDGSSRTFEVQSKNIDGIVNLDISMQEFNFDSGEGELSGAVSLGLQQNIPFDLNFELGASKGEIDLKGFLISKLNLEAGASSIKVFLPNPSGKDVPVSITSGAGKITVYIPENSGAKIETDVNLSSTNFDDFTSVNGILANNGYNNSQESYKIMFEGGVSNFTVKTYKPE